MRTKAPLPDGVKGRLHLLKEPTWRVAKSIEMLDKPAPQLVVDEFVGAYREPAINRARGRYVLLDFRTFAWQGRDPETYDVIKEFAAKHPVDLVVIGVAKLRGYIPNATKGITLDGTPYRPFHELEHWWTLVGAPRTDVALRTRGRVQGRGRDTMCHHHCSMVLIDRRGRVRYVHRSMGGVDRVTRAVDRLLVRVHCEMQWLAEEFQHRQRIPPPDLSGGVHRV